MSDVRLVKQLGAHNQCARNGCPVRKPGWRVIMGHHNVQVYACNRHLSWAVALDMISEDTAERLNWAPVPVINGVQTLREATVSPNISNIIRTDFTRDPGSDRTYPVLGYLPGGNAGMIWEAQR